METFFLAIYKFFEKRRAVLFALLIACFGFMAWFAFKVKFEEDITAILPKDEKTQKLNEVFQNSRFMDRLVITVSLADTAKEAQPDSLVAYTERFIERVNADLQPYVKKIDDKVNDELVMQMFDNILNHLPVYLTDKDYESLDTLTTKDAVKKNLEQNIKILSSPAGFALKKVIAADPSGISFLGLKKLQQLQYDDTFELYDSYIMTKDKKHLLFFITPSNPPSNTGKNALLLNGLDKTTDSLAAEFKTVGSSYFGATAVSVGNAQQIRKDNLFTQGITVVFLVVFIAWYFKKKRAPFLMMLPVAFGALFALMCFYFLRGHISVIALGTGSVVLGVAINYSMHVFNHYRHADNIREVIKDLALPMTVGSVTTIGDFFILQFVKSELLKDLGLFAAFSLIGAALCSLIFLPHLIASRKEDNAHHHEAPTWLDKFASYNFRFGRKFILLIVILTAGFLYTSRYVKFETDMSHMNYMQEKLQKAEAQLNAINAHALQSVYVVSTGKNLDEALSKNEEAVKELDNLKHEGVISRYAGVSSVIISDALQKQRIAKWNAYWTPDKKQHLLASLQQEGASLGYKSTAFDNFNSNLLNKTFVPADEKELDEVRKNFLSDYVIELPEKTMVVNLVKTDNEHKKDIYKAFDNKKDITAIDKQYLTSKLVENVRLDFNSIAWMSSILVFSMLLITYGRIELALITFIPMVITWVWILGIMGLFGIHFNIINIIISTLIFGLGDDYSIFIMDGLLQEYKTGKKVLASYKSSIFLSAITTIVGLGVLIFAKHPALRSIALIAIIGILCVVVISQILIPYLFNLLIKKRTSQGLFPWTASGIFKTGFAFVYFIFGCLLLTTIGFVLMKLNIFGKKRSKTMYHHVIRRFSWSIMYIMGNVKKKIINPLKEDFSKPTVVITNHQSSLDILPMMMLSPRIILATNKRVYHSKFFGAAIRMAGYHPISEGAEVSVEQLEETIKNGYSIVIFPEGTRSVDGNLKRFHKGAFFLAEKLQLDILPILMHGTGYTLSRNDIFLKDGTVTLKYLPRITPDDKSWGENYTTRTKKISSYFKTEYESLRQQTETPAYFRKQLINNYIYKGPVLEWYMRIKTRMENNYELFNNLVPKSGKVLDAGCGYGFMSYMLHFASRDRVITGIDYDEEKIETANHCFSKNENINFVYTDVLKFEFENYDAIILSDMLHYLQPDEQKTIIERCIHHLNENGIIIIRDGNKDLEERHKGTKLTELFSTKLIGFNKTSGNGLSFLSGKTIHTIAEANGMSCEELDNTKLTSNVVFVMKRKLIINN
ncbi:trifunctional MMPL family transporter/lysophospholipid acyltransferase/class I SAM-dependent methyltransferase [Pinibacter aurantiacus]|uniref:1-acyl-sn-glycerol-3-phosphate acyltransferase n=1 Tax=Pinibacter aurantiacus TaxID=2851599 RepID=A0A9E2W8D6_9BACT|nr:trifunctional MMPL family transporter/lysophospholipid acyltransferase/class I SAM-dependent methyltransferase [Pinibacter aurantiacus]MBV4358007.1 1-acyl-sn-glycerol-3-phosphate acyltransferase [Pinibacter aurantiacus]